MKLLLAIKGCERDQKTGVHQVLRETWVRNVTDADIYFFIGHGSHPLEPDEVRLDCGDAYLDLPAKTRAILKWSLEQNYDFTFLCDTDTYVVPDRLLASGFEEFDLVGLFNGEIGVPKATDGHWAWVSGGNGYWLSKRATEIVVKHEPTHWAEDFYVGQVLAPYFQSGELKAFSDERYGFHHDGEPYRCSVTKHYCTQGYKRQFDVRWMYWHHKVNVLDKK